MFPIVGDIYREFKNIDTYVVKKHKSMHEVH